MLEKTKIDITELCGDMASTISGIIRIKSILDNESTFPEISSILGYASSALGALIGCGLDGDEVSILEDIGYYETAQNDSFDAEDEELCDCDPCCECGHDTVPFYFSENAIVSAYSFLCDEFPGYLNRESDLPIEFISGVCEVFDALKPVAETLIDESEFSLVGEGSERSCAECASCSNEGETDDTEGAHERDRLPIDLHVIIGDKEVTEDFLKILMNSKVDLSKIPAHSILYRIMNPWKSTKDQLDSTESIKSE